MNTFKFKYIVATLSTSLLLSACGDSTTVNDPPPPPPPPAMAKFEVVVTNLTNSQPLSPIAIISHDDSYSPFMIGTAATAGLEVLAEGGDNSMLIDESIASGGSNAQSSGTSPIGPGSNELIEIEMLASEVDKLSVVTMLVNTNDAISGRANIDVSNLSVGSNMQLRGVAYDAGTERNTESAGTIPGPADGGEGFNAVRDDIADQVSMHSGVVSRDDGLATSTLTEEHRFDNTVLNISITRTE